jgi:2,4-dienoyl-CoA reductase-like NADH-dependent reductase (Old Yellow Enzyme family)
MLISVPHLHTRKDRWGGSFDNRMRLTLAVLDSVPPVFDGLSGRSAITARNARRQVR